MHWLAASQTTDVDADETVPMLVHRRRAPIACMLHEHQLAFQYQLYMAPTLYLRWIIATFGAPPWQIEHYADAGGTCERMDHAVGRPALSLLRYTDCPADAARLGLVSCHWR